MDKRWLKNYPVGVPALIHNDCYASLTDLLQQSCHEFEDKTAFENMDCQLSYGELLKKSLALSAYFQKNLQLVKGDRFAIILPNILQYPIALLAGLQLGLTIVNINPLYTAREVLIPLSDSGAKALIVLANVAENILPILPQTQVKHVLVTELGDELRPFKRIIINGYLRYIKHAAPNLKFQTLIPYTEALTQGKKLAFDSVEILETDIAFLQYTGGTTGVPKGAMLTQHNLLANVLQCTAWVSSALVQGKEKIILALPLYHIFSLTVSLAFWKLGGSSLLITNPKRLSHFVKELNKKSFSVFIGVNTLYQMLLTHPNFYRVNFDSLKLSLAGGMPITQSIAEQWYRLTGNVIVAGYGLTEASPVVSINPLSAAVSSSSVGLPLPSTEVAIIDQEEKILPMNEAGELIVRGPQVMLGYWHQSEETKKVLTKAGWLKTGDMARIDEAGYIYLLSRKKDMILVSGFNVYPSEIEEVIASHPGVAEVAVIGVMHPESGECVKAFVVKKDAELTEKAIRQFCRERLTGYKQPKFIEFCMELPKSHVGKILKTTLRKRSAVL